MVPLLLTCLLIGTKKSCTFVWLGAFRKTQLILHCVSYLPLRVWLHLSEELLPICLVQTEVRLPGTPEILLGDHFKAFLFSGQHLPDPGI